MAETIRNREDLAARVEALRQAGKKVVLTTGCYDFLHVGAVRHLRAAKALGDVLVLGLRSDESIRRGLGPKRPLMLLEDRLGVLASFEMVDFAVVYDEEDASRLIAALAPDLLAVGGDEGAGTPLERAAVESAGGRVAEIVGDPEGHTTENLIAEIVKRYGPKGR